MNLGKQLRNAAKSLLGGAQAQANAGEATNNGRSQASGMSYNAGRAVLSPNAANQRDYRNGGSPSSEAPRTNAGANVGANARANVGANVPANVGANVPANVGANARANVGANVGANAPANVGANVGANTPTNGGTKIPNNGGYDRPPQTGPEQPVAANETVKVWGDPHFQDGAGGKYDVQGQSGKTYNLLSDSGLRFYGKFTTERTGLTLIDETGLTVTGAAGQTAVEFNAKASQAKVNGAVLPDGKAVVMADGGTVTRRGANVTATTAEGYLIQQHDVGVHINAEITTGAKGVGNGRMPTGLMGCVMDADKAARHGNLGAGAQGEGAIDGKVSDYEVSGGVLGQELTTEHPPSRSNARLYTVVKGDTLWKIAERELGKGSRWQEIWALNKEKAPNPNLIRPGQVLLVAPPTPAATTGIPEGVENANRPERPQELQADPQTRVTGPQVEQPAEGAYRQRYEGFLREGITKLQAAGLRFGRADDSARGRFDSRFWEMKADPEYGAQLVLKAGRPSQAIDEMFACAAQWTMDCAEFVQAAHFYAQRQSLGATAFDAKFAGTRMNFRVHGSNSVETHALYHQETPASAPVVATAEGRRVTGKTMDDHLAQAPVGSRVMFTNPYAPITSAWHNENSVKLGDDRYAAHPMGNVSRNQLETKLVGYTPGVTRDKVYLSQVEVYRNR